MKELSIEQKAKAYEEIIKKANKMHSENCEACQMCIEELIPELAESEDERIRKEIEVILANTDLSQFALDYTFADMLAWLEKQGEQSDANKEYWRGYNEGKQCILDKYAEIEKQDKQKPADKVEPKFNIGDKIIGIISGMQYYITEVRDNCYYTESGCIIMFCAQNNFELVNQKHAWSEEDERMISAYNALIEDAQKEHGRDCVYYDDQEVFHKDMQVWLKSLKDRVQPQSKQEWKQENIEELSEFENVMMHIGDSFFGENAGLDPNDTIAIKEQATILLGLVPKQEWSQNDIEMIDWLIRSCEKEHEELCNDKYGHQDIVSDLKRDCRKKWDWLESLKNRVIPKNQWKPSEGQLDALERVVSERQSIALESLYEDIRKLKE